MQPLLEVLREHGGIAAIHTNAESKLEALWRLAKLARAFPELTFVSHDAFFSWEEAEHALYTAGDVPNIVWDIGGPLTEWSVGWGLVESWVRANGADRLAFSGDLAYSGRDARRSRLLENILGSTLSDDTKATLLGGNLAHACAPLL